MPAKQRSAWIERTAKGLEVFPKERAYLVGVSGGVDSRVLLQILLDARFTNLVICHLDHRLRGSDSERENRLIRRLAIRLKLRLVQNKYKIGRQNFLSKLLPAKPVSSSLPEPRNSSERVMSFSVIMRMTR